MIAALSTAFKFRDVAYLLVIAVLFGLWRHEQALALADREARAKAILEFQLADAERTRALEDAHAAEVARIRSEADDRVAAIRRAPSSTVCLNSGAGRAFIERLRKPANAGDPASPR